ncbi:hypothetical protein ACB092_01G109900 [Castanea dentata]
MQQCWLALHSFEFKEILKSDKNTGSPRNFLTIPGIKFAVVMVFCIVDNA